MDATKSLLTQGIRAKWFFGKVGLVVVRLEGDFPKALIAHMYDLYETLKNSGFQISNQNSKKSGSFSGQGTKPINKTIYTA